ncbi:hypothetical protein ACLB2K_025871 [Fragaria x ananassa]
MGSGWLPSEELQLCVSWVRQSTCIITGRYQCKDNLWKKVYEDYAKNWCGNPEDPHQGPRSKCALESHFPRLKKMLKKWHTALSKARSRAASGTNLVDEILVPIANGTEEMEAIMIIDILRRAKATVVVASVEDKLETIASRKVKLEADVLLDEAVKSSYDLIVLPGGIGGAQAFAKSETLVNLLKKQRDSNKPYGAICASPALVFEPHGLLKGKKATAFPALCEKLSDQSEIENRVLVDGNLITSRGPGTSMEFALGIVEKFFGREKAVELAKVMVFVHP